MAAMSFSRYSLFYIFAISILFSASYCLTEGKFGKPIKQKVSHLRIYWHDVRNGSTPTSMQIVNSNVNATTWFGSVIMFDDPLTLGPELSSKEAGKAQGFYSWVSQETYSACMNMNFVFTYGKYNGSTLTIMGSNPVLNPVRELPVIGGTGLFRFARGYAMIRSLFVDLTTNYVIVEYNITVMHY